MGARKTVKEQLRSQDGLTMIEVLLTMIIMAIVSVMLLLGWINLQRSSSFAIASNSSHAQARDALSRMVSELRDCQPTTLPSASPSATATPIMVVTAQPTVCQFYSAYNDATAAADATGTGIRLTAMWLSTSNPDASYTTYPATSTQRTYLWWRRDTAAPTGTLTSADRTTLLAKFVANNAFSIPVFNYGHFGSSGVDWNTTVTGSDLAAITAVQARTVIDANPQRPPAPVDLEATVRLRNTTTY